MAEDEPRRDGEGVLSAWSRRKRAARKAEASLDDDTVQPAAEITDPEVQTEPEEAEVDEQYIASLPSIDEITGQTDLQPFLKRGVPAQLRNAAMRKVWLANTLIRDHDDPAVDYAWDWNAPEGVPGAGGALNDEGVSKMVKDLVNRASPEEPEQLAHAEGSTDGQAMDAEVQPSSDTDMAETDRAIEETGPPAPAVRRGDSADPTGTVGTDNYDIDKRKVTDDTDDEPLARAARHGGATPKT